MRFLIVALLVAISYAQTDILTQFFKGYMTTAKAADSETTEAFSQIFQGNEKSAQAADVQVNEVVSQIFQGNEKPTNVFPKIGQQKPADNWLTQIIRSQSSSVTLMIKTWQSTGCSGAPYSSNSVTIAHGFPICLDAGSTTINLKCNGGGSVQGSPCDDSSCSYCDNSEKINFGNGKCVSQHGVSVELSWTGDCFNKYAEMLNYSDMHCKDLDDDSGRIQVTDLPFCYMIPDGSDTTNLQFSCSGGNKIKLTPCEQGTSGCTGCHSDMAMTFSNGGCTTAGRGGDPGTGKLEWSGFCDSTDKTFFQTTIGYVVIAFIAIAVLCIIGVLVYFLCMKKKPNQGGYEHFGGTVNTRA